jgi:FkbM family methyltransferase
VRSLGFELSRGPNVFLRLLHQYGIDVVLDVGANVGQFALALRRLGYRGRIVSFEPLAAEFETLQQRSRSDREWEVFNFALADTEGRQYINRSQVSAFSSIAEGTQLLRETVDRDTFGGSQIVERQAITVHRLDNIFTSVVRPGEKVLLKSDTQGFEMRVLCGAANVLSSICGAHLELSFEPLYMEERPFSEITHFMDSAGFDLVRVEPLFVLLTAQGRVLQVDATFFRRVPPQPNRGAAAAR